MAKKILIVDDSALMRRVACDIIALDSRFEVEDMARNGQEALDLLPIPPSRCQSFFPCRDSIRISA